MRKGSGTSEHESRRTSTTIDIRIFASMHIPQAVEYPRSLTDMKAWRGATRDAGARRESSETFHSTRFIPLCLALHDQTSLDTLEQVSSDTLSQFPRSSHSESSECMLRSGHILTAPFLLPLGLPPVQCPVTDPTSRRFISNELSSQIGALIRSRATWRSLAQPKPPRLSSLYQPTSSSPFHRSNQHVCHSPSTPLSLARSRLSPSQSLQPRQAHPTVAWSPAHHLARRCCSRLHRLGHHLAHSGRRKRGRGPWVGRSPSCQLERRHGLQGDAFTPPQHGRQRATTRSQSVC